MHAAFGFGIAVSVLAFDLHCRRFDARLVTRLIFDHLDLVAALFGPAVIHALQHFGPVLTLGAASARMDFDEAIIGVGFPRQERHDLVLVRPVGKRL